MNEGPELPLEAPSQHTAARAAQLKDEGNAFAGGAAPDYEAAYAKFTLALVFDPTSAILHSNRAFCANQMKLFVLFPCTMLLRLTKSMQLGPRDYRCQTCDGFG